MENTPSKERPCKYQMELVDYQEYSTEQYSTEQYKLVDMMMMMMMSHIIIIFSLYSTLLYFPFHSMLRTYERF
jgi:ABC-type lipoprotein release transport system permease subunit